MPGEFLHGLQSAPRWLSDRIENLLGRSEALGRKSYERFSRLSPEQQASLNREVSALLALKKRPEDSFVIPFSITGSSEPLDFTPDELRRAASDERFARKLFRETTDIHRISKEELDDFRKRAGEQYEESLPEIRRRESAPSAAVAASPAASVSLSSTPASPASAAASSATLPPASAVTAHAEDSRIADYIKDNKKLENEIYQIDQWHTFGAPRSGVSVPSGTEFERAFYDPSINPSSSNSRVKEIIVPKLREKIEANNKRIAEIRRSSPLSAPASAGASSATLPPAAVAALSPGPASAASSSSSAASSSSAPRPSPFAADIFKRAGVEREVNRLMEKQGIIAPMNERHEQAIRMLERSFDDDTLDLARQELLESRKHDSLKAVKPLVESALEGPDDYMRKYMDDYRTSVIKAYKEEAEEDLNEKTIPRINTRMAGSGNFYSGARLKMIEKAKTEKDKAVRREIAHLLNHARDRGMEHYESAKGRALSAADKMLAATESERGAGHERGERLRGHAVTKHGLVHSGISALGQVARAKQEQAQHEINLKRAEFESERAHPHEQLGRELSAVSGVPMPASHSVSGTVGGVPAAPNLYTLGAGALGLAAGAAGSRAAHAKGGHVKKRYADGGRVNNTDEIGGEIRNLIQEQRSADTRRHQEALKTNPLQSWLTHVGEEMLSNPSADPLLSMGRGTANTMRHLEASKERAANLYDKIQDSRLQQYQILAAYENQRKGHDFQREQFEATKSYHEKQLEQQKLHHKDNLSYQYASLNNKNNSNDLSLVRIGNDDYLPITTKAEKSAIIKEKKGTGELLQEIKGIKEQFNKLKELTKDDLISPMSPTGISKIINPIKDYIGYVNKDQDQIDKTVQRKLVGTSSGRFKIEIERKLKGGVLPEAMRKYFDEKGLLPSVEDNDVEFAAKLNEIEKDINSRYKSSDLSLKTGVHISPFELDKFEEAINSKPKIDNNQSSVDPFAQYVD